MIKGQIIILCDHEMDDLRGVRKKGFPNEFQTSVSMVL